MVVMECRSPKRCNRIRSGEVVDAFSIRISAVWPDRLRNEHTAPHALEQLGRYLNLASFVLDHDPIALRDIQLGGVLGMDHHRRAAFACERTRCLVERGIQEIARWAGAEAEWILRGGFLDHSPVVWQRRDFGYR